MLDVLVAPTVNYLTDGQIRNLGISRQAVYRDPLGVLLPYVADLSFSEFRGGVRGSIIGSSLGAHVGHVGHVISEEKVGWVAATANIAVMQDPLMGEQESSISQLPRESMRRDVTTLKAQASVTLLCGCIGPQPARTEFRADDGSVLIESRPEVFGLHKHDLPVADLRAEDPVCSRGGTLNFFPTRGAGNDYSKERTAHAISSNYVGDIITHDNPTHNTNRKSAPE